MTKFDVEKINEIQGKIPFYYLSIDNHCEFQEFETSIEAEGQYVSELDSIYRRFQEVSEMKRLPKTKFRDITPRKETVKEYEVKTKHLRVYMFHKEKKGRIVVCAGKKTTQDKDIKRLRRIKKQYFESLED